ncbi:envelope stress sensor histidine kinase CpxA [Vibrio renipiscarius]|uniref:histidine kinase n=1 Tax=Vibrio renipiscarius TaxID=1461322 RepID=A0A0C2KDU5_9VIBR|nr:envelope stress sensor histidine kinase CpxA [Vibrio renipiscarius]KII79290.1 two-component sensor protein [Vibrio renipiscarius]KII80323.1 two-component sensor protein [Vibrio renipiscarius]
MRLPRITSLYGRIFAIFWLTMFLVVIAVLALPHLDPRKPHSVPQANLAKMSLFAERIEKHYQGVTTLAQVLRDIEKDRPSKRDPRPRYFITDLEGNILTPQKQRDFKTRGLQNLISTIESPNDPQQRLYGHYMVAGPIPITLANQPLHMFLASKWDQPPPFLLRMFDRPFQLLFAVMIASTPLLLWLAWALSQPARKLERAARRVAKGEFVVDPSLEKGTSEFRQAGSAFNQMVQDVNQMISGQQRLLSDISHELRSPLTRLRMATALATRKQGESAELTRIDTEAQRLEQMISELLELSRMQLDSHTDREIQPLSSLWEAILSDAQFEAEQMGKILNYSAIPEQSISGKPKLLMSALDNIVRNAIHYSLDTIDVAITVTKEQVTVTVDDNGDGVPEEELQAIFRPFYRVSTARDRVSGGTGLGLAITESAVRQHSGTIEASRSPLGGLRVIICLPLGWD